MCSVIPLSDLACHPIVGPSTHPITRSRTWVLFTKMRVGLAIFAMAASQTCHGELVPCKQSPPLRKKAKRERERMESKEEVEMEAEEMEDEGPPPGYQTILPPPQPPPPPLSPPPRPQPSSSPQKEAPHPTVTPPPDVSTPTPTPTPTPIPTPKSTLSEIAQIVCGSCHRLLKYPPGAKQVQCSCCQTLNFVLEAHELGQVKCGSCTVLLMYPYGAPQVRCSSCQFVTEIGEHNQRPPWSAQQGLPLPVSNRVQHGC
ncbi:hypothetical protein TIFTF001_019964 [Ficus carica]|uniref:Zinc finger LSD1-type domain-containing protein n=1 Tax=Ficus carica TaxID=3494 RepID=A0AA88ACP7_FICCA|nr:hypothetical protein TIFTF001_019964 [Ficus carica]